MASPLADRLRGIVHGGRPAAVPVVAPSGASEGRDAWTSEGRDFSPGHRAQHTADPRAAAALLGGTLAERTDGAVILVDREYPGRSLHGRLPIRDIVDTIRGGAGACATMSRVWPSAAGVGSARPSLGSARDTSGPALLFLDLETTGLAGGAGTQAFLVGCAMIEGSSIRVRQFLMPGFADEPALLAEVAAFAAQHGALVTFNGRTFDVPLIETRYLFHRVPFPLEDLPHLDMLHAARRLWRARPSAAGPDPDGGGCSLSALEKHLSGLHRVGDVPGFEIPARYFQFVRDGDARPLEAVLEHNRLDLLSTAAVMARAITLIDRGPSAASTPQECLGLARLYDRAGAATDAEIALLHTIRLAARVGTEPEVQGEALRRLAWLRRRAGRVHEAAEAWQQLAHLPRCPGMLRREAREALAIYHEHRSRDFGTARDLVLDVLREGAEGHHRAAVEHRLRRLERKIAGRSPGGLMAALDDPA